MDLSNQEWELLDNNLCVDRMWEIWKIIFLSVLDKHAPIREKRVKNIPNIPWLANAIKKQIRERIVSNPLPLNIIQKITGLHTKPLEII